MKKSEWLAAREPGPLLDALRNFVGDRKPRLFACACCRRMEGWLTDSGCRAAIEVAERFADDRAPEGELAGAARRLGRLLQAARDRYEEDGQDARVWTVRVDAESDALLSLQAITLPYVAFYQFRADHAIAHWTAEQCGEFAFEPALRKEQAFQADLVRDIFGEWFQPVTTDPGWFTSDVLALANHIYDSREFEHLPILADALQDAGCDAEELLRHCRDASQPHARGCWAVDLLLGKV